MAKYGAVTWCASCGKLSYATRKLARSVWRNRKAKGVRCYRCPWSTYFHLGHLPRAVIKGSVTRNQVYGEGA